MAAILNKTMPKKYKILVELHEKYKHARVHILFFLSCVDKLTENKE